MYGADAPVDLDVAGIHVHRRARGRLTALLVDVRDVVAEDAQDAAQLAVSELQRSTQQEVKRRVEQVFGLLRVVVRDRLFGPGILAHVEVEGRELEEPWPVDGLGPCASELGQRRAREFRANVLEQRSVQGFVRFYGDVPSP